MKKLMQLLPVMAFSWISFSAQAQCTADLRISAGQNYKNCIGGNLVLYVSVSNSDAGARTSEVTALLPSGVSFQSATTSIGSYDATTGKWSNIQFTESQRTFELTINCSLTTASVGQFTATITDFGGQDCDNTNDNVTLNDLTIAACDQDNDGILDMNDLDDDNDGIIDETEYKCEVTDTKNLLTSNGLTVIQGSSLVTVQTGNYHSSNHRLSQVAFNGDAANNVAGQSQWLLVDRNNSGSSVKVWEQTINGVKEKVSYLFVFYTSNTSNPGTDPGNEPSLNIYADGQSQLSHVVIYGDYGIHNGLDIWERHEIQVVPSYGQTSITLTIYNDFSANDGNEFAIAGLSLSQMTYSNLGGDPLADTDGDGIANYLDDNFCGLNAKNVSFCMDYDGDGIINSLDIDSDNDGLPDLTETGGIDADGDGMMDSKFEDKNNNGLKDIYDSTMGGHSLVLTDFDGDGVQNIYDLDSDNDGIADIVEQGGTDHDKDGLVDNSDDDDNDGLANAFDDRNGSAGQNGIPMIQTGIAAIIGSPLVFTKGDNDHDGLPNAYDLDADGDGVTDVMEMFGNDPDGNGAIGSGNINNINDQNHNGWADQAEGQAFTAGDFDNDGIADFLDQDADNDGIADNIEAQSNEDFINANGYGDFDHDGINDAFDTDSNSIGGAGIHQAYNNDATGLPDYIDMDADNDNLPDWQEGLMGDFQKQMMSGFTAIKNQFIKAGGDPSFFPKTDNNNNGIEDWADVQASGRPAFLEAGSAFYFDTDEDGLIDMFDADNHGIKPSLVDANGNGRPDWRDNGQDIVALPVTLLQFTGEKQNTDVILNWNTATESNVSHFEVERMIGANWETIGELTAAGNSSTMKTYTFNDLEAGKAAGSKQAASYRLKMVDLDGRSEYTKIVTMHFNNQVSKVKVYPVPAADELNVSFESKGEENVTISLLDMSGKQVYTFTQSTMNGFNAINLPGFAQLTTGIYILNINGTVSTSQRIVKQ